MDKTHLDEIVKIPAQLFSILSNNSNFVSLLTNIPNATLNDELVEIEWEKCINDYNYVKGVVQESKSFCCIDTEIDIESTAIKDVYINILIGVHNQNMSLKNTGIKGFMGNRRDNLIRELDYTLRYKNGLGIGKLEPWGRIKSVNVSGGEEFACKLVTYRLTNFAKSNRIEREINV